MFILTKKPGVEFFELGKTHYDNLNYKNAFKYFIKGHEAGDIDSKVYIGQMYFCGLGMTRDFYTALLWYKMAGEAGESLSQWMVGLLYHQGMVGDGPDDRQAFEWFKKSAEQGYPDGCKFLGTMYMEGKGTQKDYKKALYWLTQAVDKGQSDASFFIASIYTIGGYGVDQDLDLAETWFMKGADKEDPFAVCGIGLLYSVHNDHKKNLEKAFEWLKADLSKNEKAKKNIDEIATSSMGLSKPLIIQNVTQTLKYKHWVKK